MRVALVVGWLVGLGLASASLFNNQDMFVTKVAMMLQTKLDVPTPVLLHKNPENWHWQLAWCL